MYIFFWIYEFPNASESEIDVFSYDLAERIWLSVWLPSPLNSPRHTQLVYPPPPKKSQNLSSQFSPPLPTIDLSDAVSDPLPESCVN